MTHSGLEELPSLPDLVTLHLRHQGLTPELSAANAQAAFVCLNRHHAPPTPFDVSTWSDGLTERYLLTWISPQEPAMRAWANPDDATEAGAYAIALASLEARYGQFALSRTGRHTGSDWWIGYPSVDTELNLEKAMRLEVAGMDRSSDEAHLLSRLSRKVEQVRKASSAPARAVVVAFSARRVAFRDT